MVRQFDSPYDFFLSYFFDYNLNIEQTLRSYGLYKGKALPSSLAAKWSSLKTKYPNEYLNAKKDYLSTSGISSSSVLSKVLLILETATKDSDKLRAAELLLRYANELQDGQSFNALSALRIEVINPADMNKEL